MLGPTKSTAPDWRRRKFLVKQPNRYGVGIFGWNDEPLISAALRIALTDGSPLQV
jgi:hypothetical protein